MTHGVKASRPYEHPPRHPTLYIVDIQNPTTPPPEKNIKFLLNIRNISYICANINKKN